jgi:hypothetical protein
VSAGISLKISPERGLCEGSWGRNRAGGSNESTRLLRDAIAVVENAKVNLGRVHKRSIAVLNERDIRTREKPGDRITSVPRIKESFSAWYGFAGRSYGMPLTLTAVCTGSDHNPRAHATCTLCGSEGHASRPKDMGVIYGEQNVTGRVRDSKTNLE